MGNSNSVEEFESNNKSERNQGFLVPDNGPEPASPRRLESFQLDKRFENHVGLPVAVDGYGGGILRFYGRHKLPPHILCGIAMHVPAVEIATGNQPGIVYLNHKNPTAILCDPQKVTLITDDPFLEQNNITRWSDETKGAVGAAKPPIDPYASKSSVRADPMLDAQEAQRQRGEDLKRRQEAERRVKLEEAENLRKRQQEQEQQRRAAADVAAAQAAREAARQREEAERERLAEQQKEQLRLQKENEIKLRKQREEDERILISQAAERRLQEAQKRREAALAAGENSANSEAAMRAAEAENARILAQASASRKAAEEMERTMELEEKKRTAALEQNERDRIANEAKQRRAQQEQEQRDREAKERAAIDARRAQQEAEAEESRRRVEYAGRPAINNSDEWWASEEGQRQRDLESRKAEREKAAAGPRKATLFDLNAMGSKPEPPRQLSQAEFNMLPAPARKSGFDIVKRARPEMVQADQFEEEKDEECTFLGNCKCANCR